MMKKETKNDERIKTDYLSTSGSLVSKTIDFSKISKKKIEKYIELMKDHQKNCANAGNFIEAELAKQRVIQLKKIQEKKEYNEALKRQGIDRKNFNGLKDKELKEFKKDFNNKYAEEITKLEEMLDALKKRHEEELSEYFTNFEKNYPKELKPSNDLIEKQRQLEYYKKTEE
jgi:hydroxymethylpyrimidine pyrophosphatase-like HAD family hydrolase